MGVARVCGFLALLVAAGCARPPIIEKPVPTLTKAEVISRLNSQASDAAGLRAKLDVKVAHVEAGLRSRDRSMPEEINRLLTDHLSELLFTPSRDADENLRFGGSFEEFLAK